MFFEGAEKKLEITISKNLNSLLKREDEFWSELVKRCSATILSRRENGNLKSFILSESSLFVWDHRILLLTCGQTKLVQSALYFIEKIGVDNIDCIFFQRKNEYRSQLQSSHFLDDVRELSKFLKGETLCLGKLHSHHTELFYSFKKDFLLPERDSTCELLMYDMPEEVLSFLTKENLSLEEIRLFFKGDELFSYSLSDNCPSHYFLCDDFIFKPCGYSLNGIRGEDYLTIHVTPQERSSYISLETNISSGEELKLLLHHFLHLFSPFSFDIVTFNSSLHFSFGEHFFKSIHVRDCLETGHEVDFRYYSREQRIPERVYRY